MRHIRFSELDSFRVALLVKPSNLLKDRLQEHYVHPLVHRGIPQSDCLAFDLKYNEHGKCPASLRKAYLAELLKAIKSLSIQTLYVCDGEYFKTLTKERKAEPHYGYALPCKLPGYEHMTVVLGLNYQTLFYNPALQTKLDLSLDALSSHLQGNYQAPGTQVVQGEYYPSKLTEIKTWLQDLHQYPQLTCDIEAFSLKFYEAGIGTIALAWDQHNGIAFPVDYRPCAEYALRYWCKKDKAFKTAPGYGEQRHNPEVKRLFREFLETYQGELIWHNAGYDVKVLIYELWMEGPLDIPGMLKGIEVMTQRIQDTQIITYLATNSCAGNKLSLKEQAHEFAGNYAQSEIDDIRLIPLPDLLRYNLVDTLATWYVFNKRYPQMVRDQQEEIYTSLFKPSIKLLLQMELTGMPLNMDKVADAEQQLQVIQEQHLTTIQNSPVIQGFLKTLRLRMLIGDYEERKSKAKNPQNIKQKPADAYDHVEFNPGSPKQLQQLLYEFLDYPILDRTDTKLPATGGKTLKKLLVRAKCDEDKELLNALVGYAEATKILTTFIKAFKENSLEHDGWHYLYGNFKLGGTVSGRLSSNNPNLQNIPSTGNVYAPLIKQCFQAPPGWLFVGADFSSLEDRISALTTRDPEKLKVYTDGYDGHCLRAYAYFGEQMPDIDPNSVESINSIAKKYKPLRQLSKTPTFALTYGGTYHAIMDQTGLPEEEAKAIEANYHKLYHVSDEWVAGKLQQAAQDGYVTVAFGLRLRTPLLHQCLMGSRKTPYEAQAESRTAGNALGQSYGLLNNRAGIELQERTLASEYRHTVLPVAHIHDAQYFLTRDDLRTVHWLNENLGECMAWQDLPEIYHPDVPLGGELDVFYPTWDDAVTLPNNASPEAIAAICAAHLSKDTQAA